MPLSQPIAPRLILASASPRRRRLLEEVGYRFDIEPADVDEEAHFSTDPPRQRAEWLAQLKAQRVALRHTAEAAIVLGADTIVVSSAGEVLGKPADRAAARRILGLLAGTLHAVITGLSCIRCDDGRCINGAAESHVFMRPLSKKEIETYLDSGLWQGKAGAYGIQDDPGRQIGEGDPFIESISGELTNVVGLPMPQVIEALEALGIKQRA